MDYRQLIAIGLQYGLPLAQEIFSHMWHKVVDPATGQSVTWQQVQDAILLGRGELADMQADADADIARQRERLQADVEHASDLIASSLAASDAPETDPATDPPQTGEGDDPPPAI